MVNSADPDQLASLKPTDLDLHFLQMQGISRFSRIRVKYFPQEIEIENMIVCSSLGII